MIDDTTLELGLRAQPPADPAYRSLITASSPTTFPVTTRPRRKVAGEPRPMLTAVRLVAAVAILALGAGVFYLAASSGPVTVPAASPSPSPTAALPRLLPSAIPAGVPNGVIETPIGQARWAHLSGDPTTLPGPLSPMPGPNGLLWFDGGGWGPVACEDSGEFECLARPELWTSTDAISERMQLALPVDAVDAMLSMRDDTWWLVTFDPTSMWRTMDAERWERLDLGALAAPGPAELEWEVRLGLPATSNGTMVFPVSYRALDAGRLLGRPDLRYAWPVPAATGDYRIMEGRQGGDPLDVGAVRIEETSDGLRFSDEAGTEIASLDGVGLDFVEAWTSAGGIRDYGVAVVDDGAVTLVGLPGPPTSHTADGELTVIGTSAGFGAFQVTGDGTTRVWRSGDGRTWAEREPLGDREGEPRDVQWVYPESQSDGTIVVRAGRRDDDLTLQVWESIDGVTWTAMPDPGPGPMDTLRLGDRWLAFPEDMAWQVSNDGLTWEPATELSEVISSSIDDVRGAGGLVVSVVGDTLFYAIEEYLDTRHGELWVVEFQSAPGGEPAMTGATIEASPDGVAEGG